MKLFGKKKERNQAESTILQTYLTSLLTLVLCVVMFLGATYAWFTSEVNNNHNEIYIGVLDVEMEKMLPDHTWVSLSAVENDASKTNLFDRNIRWEPGYTSLETLKVINRGDLAISYTLSFTDGRLTDRTDTLLQETENEAIAKCFDIWVYDHRANNDQAPAAASYADITAAGSGWVYAGSLAEALEGRYVLEGAISAAGERLDEATEPTAETAADPLLEARYTIALHMREDADVSVMGHKIIMNVKLVAYQQAYEADKFGPNYDNGAKETVPVYTVDQLRSVLDDGRTPYIARHMEIADTLEITADTRIAGGGYTLSRAEGFTGSFFLVKDDATLTLENVILEGGRKEEDGIIATGSLITAEGTGSILLEKGATLQNNDGFSAVTLADDGSLTVRDAQILGNRAPQAAAVMGGNVTIEEFAKLSDNLTTTGNGAVITTAGNLAIHGGELAGNLELGAGATFRITGGTANSSLYLTDGEASFLGGRVLGAVYCEGATRFTMGNATLSSFVTFRLATGSNTVYLAENFAGFSFRTENTNDFRILPAEGYVYADDATKPVCLNDGYAVAWDTAAGAFVLRAE